MKYLKHDLSLVDKIEDASLWVYEEAAAFRGMKGDVPMALRSDDGKYLCANERTCTLALLDGDAMNHRADNDEFLYNVTWEATPDVETAELDGASWLDQHVEPRE